MLSRRARRENSGFHSIWSRWAPGSAWTRYSAWTAIAARCASGCAQKATPRRVRELVERVRPAGVHLHNTRNTGFANAYAALEAGVTLLDASVGGIGGCPFAPRATGNVATEDLVYMLDGDGVETGVDLDALVRVAEWLEGRLGRQLPGQVYRAGTSAA